MRRGVMRVRASVRVPLSMVVMSVFLAGITIQRTLAQSVGTAAPDLTMRYSAGEVLSIIAALGVLIAGLGAVIVNIVVALRQGTKLDVSMQKQDGLSAQVAEVHTLTNSNLSAVKVELEKANARLLALTDTSNARILALTELVSDLKSEREKERIAAALQTPVPVIAMPGQPLPAVPSTPVAQQQQIERMQRVTDETHDLVADLKNVDVPAVAEGVSTIVQEIKTTKQGDGSPER